MPTREDAMKLLTQYNESDALIKHALAVESVMRHYAKKLGEDVDYWGMVGLLHDVDYEKYPEKHCAVAPEILRSAGFGDDVIHAVVSHGYGICSDVEPAHIMEKILFATDELTGLVNATAIMRPSKSILDLEVSSVKKKFKDKRFAAGVDREIIKKGCEDLGYQLDDVIGDVIEGMRSSADEIGLRGNQEV